MGKRITPEDEREMEAALQAEKSKEPKLEFYPEEPKYSFDDIILPQSVKDQILDVADYAENSHRVFEVWGLKAVYKQSKQIGVNFYGPPGTGKTMAAHAFAKHIGRKILAVNYADIESKYVGETPKNIRKAFETAKATNSILFFDEADAILSKRVTNMSSATDVSVNLTRSVMLTIMNDYQDFVIFATNFIKNFDEAFMRRIPMHVEFQLPDLECRKRLWRHYIVSTLPNTIDIDALAEKYDGLSGSDIANAVLMACFKAARSNATKVEHAIVCEMVDKALASKRANQAQSGELKWQKREVTEEYVKAHVADGQGSLFASED